MDMTPPGRHRFMVASQSPARRRGSSASRRPSPNRLNPNTVTKIATPGKVATHHAEARNCRPSTIILPQLGSGGWAPSPRYDKPVAPEDTPVAGPERARGIDEVTRPEAEALPANDARDLRPGHEPDDGRGVREPGP